MRFWWSPKCLPGGPRESRLRFFLCDYSTLSDAGRVVTFLGYKPRWWMARACLWRVGARPSCGGSSTCRAPTEETATAKGTMPRRAPSIGDFRHVAALGTGRNACATERQRRKERYRACAQAFAIFAV